MVAEMREKIGTLRVIDELLGEIDGCHVAPVTSDAEGALTVRRLLQTIVMFMSYANDEDVAPCDIWSC